MFCSTHSASGILTPGFLKLYLLLGLFGIFGVDDFGFFNIVTQPWRIPPVLAQTALST